MIVKIGVSLLGLIELAQSGNSSVNHGCPNQKSDCPVQLDNLNVTAFLNV